MEELLEDRNFQKKISRVPKHLRETFVNIMQKMCHRESEILLEFIGQSRDDMTKQATEIGKEQTKLKTHALHLEEKRKAAEDKAMDDYLTKQGKCGGAIEQYNNPDVKNTPLMELYFKQKARRKARSRGEELSESDGEFDASAANSRLSSVISTQSIPTPIVVRTIEELRDELFQNLNTADTRMQEERQRQTELLDFLKDVKSKKKSDKAQALLSEATQREKIVAESKEKQERKVKERLEEKKKHPHRNSKKRRSVVALENGSRGSANGMDQASSVDDSPTEKGVYISNDRRRKMTVQMDSASEMLHDELHIEDETKVSTKARGKNSKTRRSKSKKGEQESKV